MSKTITVLKPFVFSHPSSGDNHRLTKEEKFIPQRDKEGRWLPTEMPVSDDIAAHPFFSEHFADGRIERPEVTVARKKAAQEKRSKQNENDALELQKAEQALRRTTASDSISKAGDNDVARQLDTPVNKLSADRGAGIDKPIDEKALALELNTPVNELQAGKAKKS